MVASNPSLTLRRNMLLTLSSKKAAQHPPADFIIRVSVSLIMVEGPQASGDTQRQFSVILLKLPLPLRSMAKKKKTTKQLCIKASICQSSSLGSVCRKPQVVEQSSKCGVSEINNRDALWEDTSLHRKHQNTKAPMAFSTHGDRTAQNGCSKMLPLGFLKDTIDSLGRGLLLFAHTSPIRSRTSEKYNFGHILQIPVVHMNRPEKKQKCVFLNPTTDRGAQNESVAAMLRLLNILSKPECCFSPSSDSYNPSGR